MSEVARARATVMRDPTDVEAWRELAHLTAEAGRWSDLSTAMSQAHERFGDLGWVWEHQVLALLGLGEVKAAIQASTQGLRGCPEDAGLWAALGQASWMAGDAAGVRLAADAVRRHRAPEPVVARLDLRALSVAGEHERTLASGQVLLAQSPDDIETLLLLTTAYVALGRGSEALPLARRWVALAAGDPASWTLLASAEALESRFSEASRATARAIRLEPDSASLHHGHITMLLAATEIPAAMEATRECLARLPGAANLWRLGAVVAMAEKRAEVAVAADRVGRALEPDGPPALETGADEAACARADALAERVRDGGGEGLAELVGEIFG